ncbi:MAG TPA: signal peptidase II [Thermoleophilia bacterium]|nr:signal peptidase II [Thermoleophilia bacterium]
MVGIAFALVVDLVTKSLAEQHLAMGEVHKVLPFLYLERTANSGVAFGLLGGRGAFIIAANVIALLIVLAYVIFERRPLLAGIAGGLIIGGSLGNLVQRLTGDGRVTDFLKFPRWPNYNMADVFLVVGICAIVIGLALEAVRVWRAGRRETPASQ